MLPTIFREILFYENECLLNYIIFIFSRNDSIKVPLPESNYIRRRFVYCRRRLLVNSGHGFLVFIFEYLCIENGVASFHKMILCLIKISIKYQLVFYFANSGFLKNLYLKFQMLNISFPTLKISIYIFTRCVFLFSA